MDEKTEKKEEIITDNVSGYIDVNTKIFISRSDGPDKDVRYDSRIEDKDADSLYIAVPTEAGVPVALSRGLRISVSIWTEKGRIGFDSAVTGVRRGRVVSIKIAMPSRLYRAQLREFFRVGTYIKAKLYPLDMQSLDFAEKNGYVPEAAEAAVTDLSGGGCRFSSFFQMDKGRVFVLDFEGSPLEGAGRIECCAVRSDSSETKYVVSAEFLDLSLAQQDKLVRYVFKRQIELKDLKQS